jgi:hypothetical protein
MVYSNSDRMTGTIAITVLPQANGQYICQILPALSDPEREEIQCYGQTQEHAIANALEQLSDSYRQKVEEQQKLDWDTVERTKTGEAIDAETREQAIEALKQLMNQHLEKSEIIPLEISVLYTELPENPWIKFAGVFKDDPDFADIAEELRAERLSDDESEIDLSIYMPR